MNGQPKDWQVVAEEAILDHFRNPEHEPFHSDDLEQVIPDEHRGVISLAIMALRNKKWIVGNGVYRKSVVPSRKGSPSQEYRLIELGRDRIAGVGAGRYGDSASEGVPGLPSSSSSTDPGENDNSAGVDTGDSLSRASVDSGGNSSAAWTGGAEEPARSPEPETLSLLPEPPKLFDHDTPRAA